MNCVSQSPHHLDRHHPCGLHLLGEEGRHEDEGGGAHPQTVGQAGHHQAGQAQHGQGGEGEAEPHHQHREGVDQQEDGIDVPAVKPRLKQRGQQISDCNGRLQE